MFPSSETTTRGSGCSSGGASERPQTPVDPGPPSSCRPFRGLVARRIRGPVGGACQTGEGDGRPLPGKAGR